MTPAPTTRAASSAWAIALDVGGTSVKSAEVAVTRRMVRNPLFTPIDSASGADSILATLAHVVGHHRGQVKPPGLRGVALGFPGPFDYAAGICLIKGLGKYESLYGINIRHALQARLDMEDRPIMFRNDAEAAIVGEALHGAGRSYRRLIGVTLGTGCASTFIVDRRRVTSGEGVPPGGWLYPMPFRGQRADDCFSRRGLEVRLRAAGAATNDVKEAATAARNGNQTALQTFREFGADLGAFLEPFAVSFQAEAVLVLGGIAGAFDLLGLLLSRALSVPALAGELGNDAALLGAAELLFDEGAGADM